MNNPNNHSLALTIPSISEVLQVSVRARCRCPNCYSELNKSIFADGDSECCTACGEALWFELLPDRVAARRVHNTINGVLLSELLKGGHSSVDDGPERLG